MRNLIDAIEDKLTRERATIFATLLVPVMLAMEALKVWADPAMRWRFPYGHDFVAFWVAAGLSGEGTHQALYQPERFLAAQEAVAVLPGLLLWHYPPTYLLLIVPLAGLSFAFAWAVFSAAGLGALTLAGRRILPVPGRLGWMALLGAPVIGVTLVQGQNGAFVAAALLGGLWAREAGRNWLAAALLATLAAKPHLVLLLPVALIAVRDWRLIWQTALMVAAFVGLTLLAFGLEPWVLFWLNRGTLELTLSEHTLLAQMPTAYASIMLAGGKQWLALSAQAVSAAGAGLLVWRLWAEPRLGGDLRIAGLLMAVLLVPPYGFRYDMVAMLCATLLLTRIGLREGWLRGEKLTIATLWAAPAIFPPFALASSLQAGFLLQLLGIWAVWRRWRQRDSLTNLPADAR